MEDWIPRCLNITDRQPLYITGWVSTKQELQEVVQALQTYSNTTYVTWSDDLNQKEKTARRVRWTHYSRDILSLTTADRTVLYACAYGTGRAASKPKPVKQQELERPKKRRKLRGTKKVNCTVKLAVSYITRFPEYNLPITSSVRVKKRQRRRLLNDLQNITVKYENYFIVKLPLNDAHIDHKLAVERGRAALKDRQSKVNLENVSIIEASEPIHDENDIETNLTEKRKELREHLKILDNIIDQIKQPEILIELNRKVDEMINNLKKAVGSLNRCDNQLSLPHGEPVEMNPANPGEVRKRRNRKPVKAGANKRARLSSGVKLTNASDVGYITPDAAVSTAVNRGSIKTTAKKYSKLGPGSIDTGAYVFTANLGFGRKYSLQDGATNMCDLGSLTTCSKGDKVTKKSNIGYVGTDKQGAQSTTVLDRQSVGSCSQGTQLTNIQHVATNFQGHKVTNIQGPKVTKLPNVGSARINSQEPMVSILPNIGSVATSSKEVGQAKIQSVGIAGSVVLQGSKVTQSPNVGSVATNSQVLRDSDLKAPEYVATSRQVHKVNNIPVLGSDGANSQGPKVSKLLIVRSVATTSSKEVRLIPLANLQCIGTSSQGVKVKMVFNQGSVKL